MCRFIAKPALALGAVAATLASPSFAAPLTSGGMISVAQVVEMLAKAPTDRTAQHVLAVYLAGVGEAAGIVADAVRAACRTRPSLNAASARQSVKGGAPRIMASTPATALIVKDILDRGGCKRS